MWRCQPVADPGGCFGALDLAQQSLAPFSGQQLHGPLSCEMCVVYVARRPDRESKLSYCSLAGS